MSEDEPIPIEVEADGSLTVLQVVDQEADQKIAWMVCHESLPPISVGDQIQLGHNTYDSDEELVSEEVRGFYEVTDKYTTYRALTFENDGDEHEETVLGSIIHLDVEPVEE